MDQEELQSLRGSIESIFLNNTKRCSDLDCPPQYANSFKDIVRLVASTRMTTAGLVCASRKSSCAYPQLYYRVGHGCQAPADKPEGVAPCYPVP